MQVLIHSGITFGAGECIGINSETNSGNIGTGAWVTSSGNWTRPNWYQPQQYFPSALTVLSQGDQQFYTITGNNADPQRPFTVDVDTVFFQQAAMAQVHGDLPILVDNIGLDYTVHLKSGGVTSDYIASGAINGSNTFITSGMISSGAISDINQIYAPAFSGAFYANSTGGSSPTIQRFSGLTTGSFSRVFTVTSTAGVYGTLGVKNTSGANSLEWQLVVSDFYGQSGLSAGPAGVGPLATLSVRLDDAGSTITPGQSVGGPCQGIGLNVRDLSAGNHTGYDVCLGLNP